MHESFAPFTANARFLLFDEGGPHFLYPLENGPNFHSVMLISVIR